MPRSRPRPSRTVIAALVVGAGAAGFGAVSAAAGAVTVTQLPLQRGELVGFHPTARAILVPTAAGFAGKLGQPAEGARLRSAGFRKAGFEQLAGPAKAVAFSYVIQFRDAAAARNEVRRTYRRDLADKSGVPRAVSVAGIPGAVGLAVDIKNTSTDLSYVTFADGSNYYYSAIFGVGAQKAPTVAKILAAARAQYKRVHGQAAAARG